MIGRFKKVSDDIRWKLTLIKTKNVSIRLNKRAILDISDFLDDYYEKSENVNMFFMCHVDSLYNISKKDFIKGFWKAMEKDEHYEILHYLKQYLNRVVKG